MKLNRMFFSGLLLLLLGSCTHNEMNEVEATHRELGFTATIEKEVETRATATAWEKNDRIGLFMVNAGKPLAEENIAEQILNTPFITLNGDGRFYPDKKIIDFPAEGSYDFYAYYPYDEDLEGTKYMVNVTFQNQPEEIDFMVADNLKGQTAKNASGNLKFEHQLAHLSLLLSSSDHSDLTGITATLKNVYTYAEYHWDTKAMTIDQTSKDKVEMFRSGNTISAILLPGEVSNETVIELKNAQGKVFKIQLNKKFKKLDKNHRYTIPVNVTSNGTAVSPEKGEYKAWFETPVIAKATLEKKNIHYINHFLHENWEKGGKVRNYSMLYDDELKMSYWVAYPLCSYYLGGQTRTEAWGYDPMIDTWLQPNMKKGLGGGFDRGHQIPSGDRTRNRETNAPTFYYTNMTAQVSSMNQQIWQALETKVRDWARSRDTIFVVTGASDVTLTDRKLRWHHDNSGKEICVPKFYYKVLAVRTQNEEFKTIGFILNNENYPNRDFWVEVKSVAEVEKQTRFTFFPNIPAEAKEKVDRNYWR